MKYNLKKELQSNKSNRNIMCGGAFLATNLVIQNANAGVLDGFIDATRDLIAAIQTDAPVFFTLGIVIVLALLVIYILFPKFRTTLHWIFGPIVGVIVISIILQYYSDSIKAIFNSTFNIFNLVPGTK